MKFSRRTKFTKVFGIFFFFPSILENFRVASLLLDVFLIFDVFSRRLLIERIFFSIWKRKVFAEFHYLIKKRIFLVRTNDFESTNKKRTFHSNRRRDEATIDLIFIEKKKKFSEKIRNLVFFVFPDEDFHGRSMKRPLSNAVLKPRWRYIPHLPRCFENEKKNHRVFSQRTKTQRTSVKALDWVR